MIQKNVDRHFESGGKCQIITTPRATFVPSTYFQNFMKLVKAFDCNCQRDQQNGHHFEMGRKLKTFTYISIIL